MDCIVTLLLHYLVKPTRQPGKSTVKPTIQDSQENQIKHLHCINDLDRFISEKKTVCMENKLTIQPFIIVVGKTLTQLEQFIVYTNDVYHKFDTFLSSLDFCYKFFYIFNLSYPVQSKNLSSFRKCKIKHVYVLDKKPKPKKFKSLMIKCDLIRIIIPNKNMKNIKFRYNYY